MDHDGVAWCIICQRKAKGYGYCYKLQFETYPYYQFCTKRCQDIGVLRANQGNTGMIDKTPREREAIKAARKNLAEVLKDLNLMQPFFNRTPEDIDRIIEACVDGFRRAQIMQQQTDVFDDEIPF
jgi:hypothetical protein